MEYVALAGVSGALVALVVLHVLPTGLSPMSHAVSEYGITRYRVWYRVQTIGMGLAGAAVAVRLHDRGTAVLLGIFAAARLLIGWFPMDPPGVPPTRTGRQHTLLALAAFVPVTAAAMLVDEHVGWFLVAGLALTVATAWPGPLHRLFGLAERLFYLAMVAFLVVAAVR